MQLSRAFRDGVVATPHYLASEAGAAVLASGGNAVDAIVAANLALGVVAPYYCGYGGDLLALVWDGSLHGYRSTGRTPAAATLDAVRAASADGTMPVCGPHAVTVPGAVRGWFDLLERFGTRTFAELSATARSYAADGFVLTKPGAYRLRGAVAVPGHLGVDTRALVAAYADAADGALLRQPALARTIDTLASDGPDAYYRGPIGAAIARTVREHGGVMDASDLAAHEPAWVEPLLARFAGRWVVQLPPPTQGVTALEMLRLADGVGVDAGRLDEPETIHLLVEIAKAALADRDAFVGDPAAMPFAPERLIDDEWIAARRSVLDRERSAVPAPRALADGDTAYMCAADASGLSISLIQSNFLAIGSGLHVGEWGINLHNRGSAFTLRAGHPNALAGSKLPMHTLIPGMVFGADPATASGPELVYGTMGGHAQAQIHLQLLVRILLGGADLQAAIAAPRWSADPATGALAIERRFDAATLAELDRRGHRLTVLRDWDDGVGHAHAIRTDGTGLLAACDPRAESAVCGR